ncbi:leu operon leader peptide [Pantoea sp. Acro-835]|uniref:leu operon leader peptide n=1 Tax=Candidatus Pantoea multigeneris TaxID=2608357 RepID=A0ABX0RFS0_9GAMM|nr:leu operon leader peptide [Pantoea multigeneris]
MTSLCVCSTNIGSTKFTRPESMFHSFRLLVLLLNALSLRGRLVGGIKH